MIDNAAVGGGVGGMGVVCSSDENTGYDAFCDSSEPKLLKFDTSLIHACI